MKRKVRKKIIKKFLRFIAIIVVIWLVFLIFNKMFNPPTNDNPLEPENKAINYFECMNSPVNDYSFADLDQEQTQLTEYLEKYKVSVVYENLSDNYSFSYNENKSYYAASTVKLLYVLYLYDMASQGKIDLDENMKYESKHTENFSDYMSKYSVGSMHKLRDLAMYSISVSDNTAHLMIADYIGRETIREYARKIGMTVYVTTDDVWGDGTAKDANILLRNVYNFIEKNKELGAEIKSIMTSTKNNELQKATDDVVAHKYGWWSPNFHDVGIVYNEYPYSLAIFTQHSSGYEFRPVIKNIHIEIIKLHDKYINLKKQYCENK